MSKTRDPLTCPFHVAPVRLGETARLEALRGDDVRDLGAFLKDVRADEVLVEMVPALQITSQRLAFNVALLDARELFDDIALGKVLEGVVVGREVPLPGDEVVAQPRVGHADLRGGEEELAPEEAGAGERGDEASSRFRDLESLGRYSISAYILI